MGRVAIFDWRKLMRMHVPGMGIRTTSRTLSPPCLALLILTHPKASKNGNWIKVWDAFGSVSSLRVSEIVVMHKRKAERIF
jgi:hypothetical protein